MTTAQRVPHPALRGYVGDYVGYRVELGPGVFHHGLPSTWATVIIALDQPLPTGWVGQAGSCTPRWHLIGGLHLRPALVRPRGRMEGIQLALTPRGVRTLIGLPLAALADDVAGLGEVPLTMPESFPAHLRLARSWDERFDLLDGWLLQRLGRDLTDRAPHVDVAQAWHVLRRRGGNVGVDALAADLGWSVRWLRAHFRAEYGISPKQAARLFRFERARRLIEDPAVPLADAAHRSGYSDQAHLSRDCVDLAAMTPTQLRRSPYLRDDEMAS